MKLFFDDDGNEGEGLNIFKLRVCRLIMVTKKGAKVRIVGGSWTVSEPLTAGVGLGWLVAVVAVIVAATATTAGFQSLNVHSIEGQQLSQSVTYTLSGQSSATNGGRS
jgi:hypothetical protein